MQKIALAVAAVATAFFLSAALLSAPAASAQTVRDPAYTIDRTQVMEGAALVDPSQEPSRAFATPTQFVPDGEVEVPYTDQTIREIREHNAVYEELCGARAVQ